MQKHANKWLFVVHAGKKAGARFFCERWHSRSLSHSANLSKSTPPPLSSREHPQSHDGQRKRKHKRDKRLNTAHFSYRPSRVLPSTQAPTARLNPVFATRP